MATYGPFVGIYFVAYEQWKRKYSMAHNYMFNYNENSRYNAVEKMTPQNISFFGALVGGAFSGAVASYATNPLDVIKTRLQVS